MCDLCPAYHMYHLPELSQWSSGVGTAVILVLLTGEKTETKKGKNNSLAVSLRLSSRGGIGTQVPLNSNVFIVSGRLSFLSVWFSTL